MTGFKPGPLVSEAFALPTEPQPLPPKFTSPHKIYLCNMYTFFLKRPFPASHWHISYLSNNKNVDFSRDSKSGNWRKRQV